MCVLCFVTLKFCNLQCYCWHKILQPRFNLMHPIKGRWVRKQILHSYHQLWTEAKMLMWTGPYLHEKCMKGCESGQRVIPHFNVHPLGFYRQIRSSLPSVILGLYYVFIILLAYLFHWNTKKGTNGCQFMRPSSFLTEEVYIYFWMSFFSLLFYLHKSYIDCKEFFFFLSVYPAHQFFLGRHKDAFVILSSQKNGQLQKANKIDAKVGIRLWVTDWYIYENVSTNQRKQWLDPKPSTGNCNNRS